MGAVVYGSALGDDFSVRGFYVRKDQGAQPLFAIVYGIFIFANVLASIFHSGFH